MPYFRFRDDSMQSISSTAVPTRRPGSRCCGVVKRSRNRSIGDFDEFLDVDTGTRVGYCQNAQKKYLAGRKTSPARVAILKADLTSCSAWLASSARN